MKPKRYGIYKHYCVEFGYDIPMEVRERVYTYAEYKDHAIILATAEQILKRNTTQLINVFVECEDGIFRTEYD